MNATMIAATVGATAAVIAALIGRWTGLTQGRLQADAAHRQWRREVRRDAYAALALAAHSFTKALFDAKRTSPLSRLRISSEDAEAIRTARHDLFAASTVAQLEASTEVGSLIPEILNRCHEAEEAFDAYLRGSTRHAAALLRTTQEAIGQFYITRAIFISAAREDLDGGDVSGTIALARREAGPVLDSQIDRMRQGAGPN